MFFAKARSHDGASLGMGGAGGNSQKGADGKDGGGGGIGGTSPRGIQLGHVTPHLFDDAGAAQHRPEGHDGGAGKDHGERD